MQFSEKELENFIYADLKNNKGFNCCDRGLTLQSMGLPVKPLWVRQLNIDPYGILDIAGFYRHEGSIHVDLIELKIVQLTIADVEQVFRYKKGLEHYLENTFKSRQTIYIHTYLIGSSYDGFYIQNNCPISIGEFSYDLSGIDFSITNPFSDWHKPNGNDKSFRKFINNLNQENGKAIY